MKKLIALCLFVAFLSGCGGGSNETSTNETTSAAGTGPAQENTAAANPTYDPKRGEGKFRDVKLEAKLDPAMAEKGEKVSDLKCASCHKMTDEKLVGPGWQGVTSRHAPEWILNFMTNTDAMIDKDPKAQAMLEICMVRMPNQNLSDEDARSLLEFMRKNDGVK
ncbi:MAG: c-type cytochrome [Bacteroidota bacterium]